MAEALARGFLDKKVIEAGDIWCCDPSKARMDVFTEFGCSNVKNAAEVRTSRLCDSLLCWDSALRRRCIPLCSSGEIQHVHHRRSPSRLTSFSFLSSHNTLA